MENSLVRIESIEIKNFKNVRYGRLSFENNRKPYKSSILGLYGQNGSGKTALIDAIALLKFILTGQSAPGFFANCVHVDAEYASLKYEFKVAGCEPESEYTAFYEFKLGRSADEATHGQEYLNAAAAAAKSKPVIFDEVLSYSYRSGGAKTKLLPVVDTRTEDVFVPATKYRLLVGKEKATRTDLLVAKKYAAATARSFIFSQELLQAMQKNCQGSYHLALFEKLHYFGVSGLFVISTANTGLITLNTLPLVFNYAENGKTAIGSLVIRLNGSSLIAREALDIVRKVTDSMNIVLTQLIPGLTIGVKDLGSELLPNGNTGSKIQLISRKNSKEIPLQYESEGIKKIISILQLLIVIYNKPSITVAVDEIDSGVFEYLLGELLRIISEKGKGQLIFTSHNLRPLETLHQGFIAFTTTNPDNRYIRLSNVKTNNNLRDFYYRDIVLGEQSEAVYEPTNNYEIALAFREAGELSGS